MQQHEYSIKSIVHYELYFGSEEIYYWDMFTNEFRVGGVDINFDTNRILRISADGTVAPTVTPNGGTNA